LDVLPQINGLSHQAQSIVGKLVESLNLRESILQQDKESLDNERKALNDERLMLQAEKDSLEKQKLEQKQIEQILENLNTSYLKLLDSQKKTNYLLWGVGGVATTSVVTSIILFLIK